MDGGYAGLWWICWIYAFLALDVAHPRPREVEFYSPSAVDYVYTLPTARALLAGHGVSGAVVAEV